MPKNKHIGLAEVVRDNLLYLAKLDANGKYINEVCDIDSRSEEEKLTRLANHYAENFGESNNYVRR